MHKSLFILTDTDLIMIANEVLKWIFLKCSNGFLSSIRMDFSPAFKSIFILKVLKSNENMKITIVLVGFLLKFHNYLHLIRIENDFHLKYTHIVLFIEVIWKTCYKIKIKIISFFCSKIDVFKFIVIMTMQKRRTIEQWRRLFNS